MPILLFTLFGIALCIIIAGYFLTPKPPRRSPQEGYYAGRVRAGRRVREPLRPRRASYVQAERRTIAFTWPSLAVGRIMEWRPGEQSSWMGLALILSTVFVLGFFLLRTLLPAAILVGSPAWFDTSLANPNPGNQNDPRIPFNASQHLVRISQLDPGQYASTDEFNTWAYSACSAAAMTEVINSYGHHYRITDILKVESRLGEITPALGLLEDIGIERTVAQFGFKTDWGHKLTLDQLINIANHGTPVIISFPPDRYDGGHLVVVSGGDRTYVSLADSSLYNRHSLTRQQFMNWWEGFTAIVTPK